MSKEYASVEIKRQGDKTIVMGIGQNGRGRKYIKQHEVVEVKSPADPNYKKEIAAAVAKLFAVDVPTG